MKMNSFSESVMQNKKWLQKLNEIEEKKISKDEDLEEETPFDILEKIKDILEQDIKDPSDDNEIKKILKQIASKVKKYIPQEEKEEEEEQQQKQQKQQIRQQPVQNQPIMPEPMPQQNQDLGANMPTDNNLMAGAQLAGNFPASGGQM